MISYHLECISHKLNMNKAASFPSRQFEKKTSRSIGPTVFSLKALSNRKSFVVSLKICYSEFSWLQVREKNSSKIDYIP